MMDSSKTIGGNSPPASNTTSLSDPAGNARVKGVAQTAHRTVDSIADEATAQVDRVSGTVHRAVNSAADAASSAADRASGVPDQAKQVQTKTTRSRMQLDTRSPDCLGRR